MCWVFLLILLGIVFLSFLEKFIRCVRIGNKISEIIKTQFLIEPCSRCNENEMRLEDVSPNGKSISYKCNHCKKKMRASAATKEAEKVIYLWNKFQKFGKSSIIDFTIRLRTPDAIMPYEQTTREPIPENVRSRVWRRDGGKCVQCGSKENLQFDHIIPVSKGGATTVANLQILCRACNLCKSAKI